MTAPLYNGLCMILALAVIGYIVSRRPKGDGFIDSFDVVTLLKLRRKK